MIRKYFGLIVLFYLVGCGGSVDGGNGGGGGSSPPGVYTYHNNLARDGTNTQESILTPANVNGSTFGKLFSCPVDGNVYAQQVFIGKHHPAIHNDHLAVISEDSHVHSELSQSA